MNERSPARERGARTGSPATFYWQLVIFLIGFLLVAGLGYLYSNLADNVVARTDMERARLFAGEEIVDGIQEVEKDVYQMVATTGVPAQQRMFRIILERISKLEHDIGVLKDGGTVKRISPLNVEGRDEIILEEHIRPDSNHGHYPLEFIEVGSQLDKIRETVSQLLSMLEKRESIRQLRNADLLLSHEREIARFLKTVPPLFFRVNENANRLFFEGNVNLQKLEAQLHRERERYRLFANIAICLVILFVMASGFLFFRQVDTSSRKLSEALDDMRQARDEAEQSNQAKGQFLANMSHEIRTPMNGVLGMLDILMESNLDPSQARLANMAHGSAEKLLMVINDILDFSKIEAGRLELHPSDFSIRELIKEIAEIFLVRAHDKRISFSHEVDRHIPEVLRGDVLRLRQILINLLGNAFKFTEEGEISLSVSQVAGKTGAMLRFHVRDTGPGIEKDKLSHIFESFSQADGTMSRRHEGTGLGLAISRQLAEMMGGEIGVESTPGQGSLFWFTVVASAGSTLPEMKPEDGDSTVRDSNQPAGHKLRVLLAEDNPVNQEVGRLILEGLDCEVDVVEDGSLAVEAVFGEEYDMVFMDCQMPEVDGYEASRIIRQREQLMGGEERRIPIVALTAHAMEGDRENCMAAGMDDYLPKPFNADQISEILRKWAPPRDLPEE
jgi:signal transduction histidine kinase/CheY-like chemotaxis protein